MNDIASSIAANLSRILTPFQGAINYLTDGSPEDIHTRISILFALAEPSGRSVKTLAEELGVEEADVKALRKRGLIRIDRGTASLRRDGESLVALLFMMNKQVEGGTSEGILDIVQAAQAGGYGGEFIASLVLGSARRLAERLQETTRTEELDHIEAHRSDRKTAWGRVDKVIELLDSGLAPDTLADLRAASANLAKVGASQAQVLTRIRTEDFRLPAGTHYSDLVRVLSAHSDESMKRLVAVTPILKRRPFQALQQYTYSEGIKHHFTEFQAVEGELEIAAPVEGDAWDDKALLEFEDAVVHAVHGDQWHQIEQSTRSYLRGVWYAFQGRLPKRLREQGISLELTPDRIHEAPFLDTPIVIVRKQHD